MKITKYGQCCLRIETDEKRILTDPGAYSTTQNDLVDLDVILITHEHSDHLHIGSLHHLLKQNPDAQIVANSSVARLLAAENITCIVVEGRDQHEIAETTFEACDWEHAEIFEDIGLVQNTGYLINDSLFYPGDAYAEIGKEVEILALPVGGPWCRITDAIHYALTVAPKTAFPVHDVFLNDQGLSVVHNAVGNKLKEHNISFVPIRNDETIEL